MKNQAIRSPLLMGLAGALLGMSAARLIRNATASKRRERIEWEPAWEDTGLAGRARHLGADVREGVRDRADEVRQKAVDLKDRAADAVAGARDAVSDGVSAIRERLPSTDEVRDRVGSAYRASRARVDSAVRYGTIDQPAIGALLAVGVGAALGLLLPVSEQEERALAPIRERAVENLGLVEDKVRQMGDRLESKIAGATDEQAERGRGEPEV
jgi:gas vesicle protein